MNKAERYIAKVIFKNRIFQYKGQQFEDFFVSIMTKANPKFQAVKAYGNIGDRKNDGFIKTTGTYYQVFAPDDITKYKTIYKGTKKLEEDFEGLYKHWNDIYPIKKFFFVVNDKYEGLSEPIIKKVSELNKNPIYSEIEINTFTVKDLERIFDSLDENDVQDIIGYIPDEDIPILEYEALHETIEYILNTELKIDYIDNLIVPDFDEKIKFNGLSFIVNQQLVLGSYQENLLTNYFNENPGIREILQKKFHALYEQAKENIPEMKENYADCRFFYILEQASFKQTMAIRTSVLVLMAYYFSSCDIFEEPK